MKRERARQTSENVLPVVIVLIQNLFYLRVEFIPFVIAIIVLLDLFNRLQDVCFFIVVYLRDVVFYYNKS